MRTCRESTVIIVVDARATCSSSCEEREGNLVIFGTEPDLLGKIKAREGKYPSDLVRVNGESSKCD